MRDPGPYDEDTGLFGGKYSCGDIDRTPDGDEYMQLGAKILVKSTCYKDESPTPEIPAEPDAETTDEDQLSGNNEPSQRGREDKKSGNRNDETSEQDRSGE